jgi:hypothetical protein
MAFNGSGLFVRVHNWVADKNNSIDITASEMDAEDDGFAAGLTLAVTRDGQGKMAADFLPNADASYDVGNASFRWRNLKISGTITANGTKDITPNSGSWTGNMSGPWAVLGPAFTLKWERVGSQVTVWCDAAALASAAIATGATVPNLPAEITPTSTRNIVVYGVEDNGVQQAGVVGVLSSGNLTINPLIVTSSRSSAGSFSGTGTTGITTALSFSYSL